VSETHLSLFRSGKVRGVRFSTLAKLCAALDCQPGDLSSCEYAAADLSAPDDEVNDGEWLLPAGHGSSELPRRF
jgi:putative transcriptional regulator